MNTLREMCINRNNQLKNCNGTEALNKRIAIMKELAGNEKTIAATKLKGYIEALSDNNIMSLHDANDWIAIIDDLAGLARGRI